MTNAERTTRQAEKVYKVMSGQRPPTRYNVKNEHANVWAQTAEQAANLLFQTYPSRGRPNPANLVTKKFGWSDGRLYDMRPFLNSARAKEHAAAYKGHPNVSARLFTRTFHAGGAGGEVYCVVVRHRWELK